MAVNYSALSFKVDLLLTTKIVMYKLSHSLLLGDTDSVKGLRAPGKHKWDLGKRILKETRGSSHKKASENVYKIRDPIKVNFASCQ